MNLSLKNRLIKIAEKRQVKDDPSHDFEHVRRVLNLAVKIGKSVGADLDIVTAAAIFHDTVVYQKDSPKRRNETKESAKVAGDILKKIKDFPKEKIHSVMTCIKECSFTNGIVPTTLESVVLQDADLLESTGAISIIRTFSSCGHMNRPFYNHEHPLNKEYEVDFSSGVGLFHRRLLVAHKRLRSKSAKAMAKHRTVFLNKFLSQLRRELRESGII
jgi:uncharacterized protein